ncbi:hypothetical protein DMB37_02050 [Nocardia sp. CS682]|nr:hypothetical protein DMB37_02050 [Nocardia sp. CS682]
MDREQNYFDALIADYVAARDDERELNNQLVGVFGGVVTTLALFGAFVTFVSGNEPSNHIHDAAAAAVPLIPLALACMLQVTASQATVRSFYSRALERELAKLLPPGKPDMAGYPLLRPVMYREMIAELNSLSHGYRIPRILQLVAMLSLEFIFLGLLCYMARQYAFYLQFIMLVVYLPVIVLLVVEAGNGTVNGRSYFLKLVRDTRARRATPLLPLAQSPTGERKLLSYLLLPRPMDLSKALFFPIGTLTLIVMQPSVLEVPYFVPRMLVLWFILEILIYQGRYQLNDLRGLDEDQVSPNAAQRGRIPTRAAGLRVAAYATLGAIGARVVLTVILCGLPFVSFFHHVIPLAAGVLAIAVLYEGIRSVERNRFDACDPRRHGPPIIGWLVVAAVGLGYPLRAFLGLSLPPTTGGGKDIAWEWKWPWNWDLPWQWEWPWNWVWPGQDDWTPPFGLRIETEWPIVLELAAYCFFLGIVFVSMTWCLEGGTYVSRSRMVYGRRIFFADVLIARKPHLLLLLRQTRSSVEPLQQTIPVSTSAFDGRGNHWLDHGAKPHAIWNAALLIATALALLLVGRMWGIPWHAAPYWVCALIAMAALMLWATLPVRVGLPILISRWLADVLVTVAAVFTLVTATIAAAILSPRSTPTLAIVIGVILTPLAYSMPTLMYKYFRAISYNDLRLPDFLSTFTPRTISRQAVRLIVGHGLIDRIWPTDARTPR